MLKRGLTEEEAHWQYLRLLARHVPGKSLGDCDHCLKYMERQRVAYFGPVSERGRERRAGASSAQEPFQRSMSA